VVQRVLLKEINASCPAKDAPCAMTDFVVIKRQLKLTRYFTSSSQFFFIINATSILAFTNIYILINFQINKRQLELRNWWQSMYVSCQ
jgi:hypothetical protein